MELQALGYFGVRARNLEDWTAFATRFLGFELVEKSQSALTFRMDDRRQRVVVEADHNDGAGFFGWEAADAAALDRLAARLEAGQVKVERPGRGVADARRVKDLQIAKSDNELLGEPDLYLRRGSLNGATHLGIGVIEEGVRVG